MVDGATRCIKPEWDKQSLIDAELHNIVRMKKGVSFKRIKKNDKKIRHAATAVPKGKLLMMLMNRILQVKPRIAAAKQTF